jgi:hypothetical protein
MALLGMQVAASAELAEVFWVRLSLKETIVSGTTKAHLPVWRFERPKIIALCARHADSKPYVTALPSRYLRSNCGCMCQ